MPTAPPIFFPSFPPPGFSPQPWRMPAALPALPIIRQNHPLGRARALDKADTDHGEAHSGPIENLAKAHRHLPAQVEISIDQFFS